MKTRSGGERFIRVYPQDDAAIRRRAAQCIPYCHSAVTLRAEVVRQGINYDPEQPFLIDFEFFLRVARHWKVANLREPLVKRRVRSESYFQRSFSAARQNRRLVRLTSQAIRQFRLPRRYYAYSALRLGYPLLPNVLKRCVRRASGLAEEEPARP